MNRPYTAHSPYSLTPTERIRYRAAGTRDFENLAAGPDTFGDDHDTDVYPRYDGEDPVDYPYSPEPYAPDYDAEYGDEYDSEYDSESDDVIDEASIDRRWMWIGGVAGAVLFVAVIATSMILGGGDSGSVSATVASPLPTSAAPTPSRAPSPSVAAPPTQSLPPETVTTLTPSAEVPPPPPQPALLPPPQAAPPPPAAPGTITYRITGNRELIDLVTVIYTDQQGALQTELNVALPWAKTIVLNPGVTLSSVTATSVRGQLNCSITDASGNLIAVQNNNSIITNCTR